MNARKIVLAVLAALVVVMGAALWAQAPQPRAPQGDGFVVQPNWVPAVPVTPTVLTDADLGFRVLGMRGQTPVGEWVVRINGEWRRVETGDPSHPLR